jgi:glyoxylase-like metal-dependent hydrolase (beta-lactamase superfamily II)
MVRRATAGPIEAARNAQPIGSPLSSHSAINTDARGTSMRTQPQSSLLRRNFCFCCVATTAFAATGGWLTPSEAFAQARAIVFFIQSAAATAEIAVHDLRRNVSVLEGSGGNIAVLSGPDGKLLVDAGIAVSRPRLAAALASLGTAPVIRLINTHWHFDHTDGNEWLHANGAVILAHENTRKRLSTAQRVEDWRFDFPPSAAGAVPTEVFAGERDLTFADTRLSLKHYEPAHTDGDISVRFADADVLHVGDTFWNGIYPFIDYSTGGSIDGMIRATEANLATTTDRTIIIPGHGPPVSNKAQLQEYRDMLVEIRENVARLKRQGRPLDDVIAAKPTAAHDAKWGQFVIDPAFFAKLVFAGV